MNKTTSTTPVTLELLASVPHYSDDAILITDAQLNLPGPRIVYVNPAFTRLTGYTPQDVIGQTPRILQGPNTDRRELERIRGVLSKDGVFHGCAINYRKDGTEYWNEWHIEPIRNARGRVTHYLAIQRNVTGRKKLEQDLLDQKEALEKKNAALHDVLEHIEFEKQKVKHQVRANVEDVVLPLIKKLQRKGSKIEKQYLTLIEQSLSELSSSFGAQVSGGRLKLSPREVEIANMIKTGMTNKEISELLHLSTKTIETHRNRIRRKLGLINKELNLTSVLQSLGQ